jgi:hypothetical protein
MTVAAEMPLGTVHVVTTEWLERVKEWLERVKACVQIEGGHFELHSYKLNLENCYK